MTRVVAGIVAGLLVGWLIGVLMSRNALPSDPVAAASPGARAESPGPDDGPARPALASPRRAASPSATPEEELRPETARVEVPEIPMLSEVLLEYFRAEFRDGWREQRAAAPLPGDLAAGEQAFCDTVRALPAALGRERALQASDLDAVLVALEQGAAVALIEAIGTDVYAPPPAGKDWEAFERFFARASPASVVDGAEFALGGDTELEPGMTLAFGPGVFTLEEGRLRGSDRLTLPADITISGAGKDATLLRLGDIGIRENVERLSFRDLTLDAGNDGLFDMRSGSLVLDLERVRVVRFDAGHGGCVIFSTKGAVIRARSSDFMGGYGKQPGWGDLFSAGPFLAEFEDCRFELLRQHPARTSPHDRIVFRRCSFQLLTDPRLSRLSSEIAFIDCEFGPPLDRTAVPAEYQKDLGDLFWQVREE